MNTPSHPVIAALSAALTDASSLILAPVESIAVEKVEATEWPDSCLGLPTENEVCAEVITPGYLIQLSHNFTYHADQRGTVRRVPGGGGTIDNEIRLTYVETGGITGRTRTFDTDSSRLNEAEEEELRRLITEADFFDVPNADPTPIIMDGIVIRLWIAVGRRSHEIVRGTGIEIDDTPAVRALFAWVDERTPPLFPRADIETA